jgi:hypothetical protein
VSWSCTLAINNIGCIPALRHYNRLRLKRWCQYTGYLKGGRNIRPIWMTDIHHPKREQQRIYLVLNLPSLFKLCWVQYQVWYLWWLDWYSGMHSCLAQSHPSWVAEILQSISLCGRNVRIDHNIIRNQILQGEKNAGSISNTNTTAPATISGTRTALHSYSAFL